MTRGGRRVFAPNLRLLRVIHRFGRQLAGWHCSFFLSHSRSVGSLRHGTVANPEACYPIFCRICLSVVLFLFWRATRVVGRHSEHPYEGFRSVTAQPLNPLSRSITQFYSIRAI